VTTEIAILNGQAVALAADSAATAGGVYKVYPKANKIFALSRLHPVGIMVWNSSAFMGLPWETVIKLYRERLGDKSFPTLPEYMADFVAFLLEDARIAPSDRRDAFVSALIRERLQVVYNALRQAVDQRLAADPTPIQPNEFEAMAVTVVRDLNVDKASLIADAWTAADIEKAHGKALQGAIAEMFGELPLGSAAKDIATLTCETIVRQIDSESFAGVVVAGFGVEDVFPLLVEREIDGIVDGRVRCWERGRHSVADMGPGIVPFAQRDMIEVFVQGVSSDYQAEVESLVRRIVDSYPSMVLDSADSLAATPRKAVEAAQASIKDRYIQESLAGLGEWRYTHYVEEVMSIVETLPKEDLAELAEALVSLTSLRRRMTRGQETVGGPIDVAVISKGDGLIWIKRKHYFDPLLNPQYMSTKFGRAL